MILIGNKELKQDDFEEDYDNKMLNEITELVNQTKSNLVQKINKSIVYV